MNIGVYPLNNSRFLLGSDPKSVQSMISSPDEGFEDVDEHVSFQCQFSDSVTVLCTASFNSYRGNSIQLIGTEGRIRSDDAYGILKQRHITLSIDETTVQLSPPPINEIAEQCDYFVDRVDSEADEPDGLNGLIDIVTLDSVYQADAENRTVSVPLAEYLDAV